MSLSVRWQWGYWAVAALAFASALGIACSSDHYEGGGRRTDLGSGGFSTSGTVSSDAGVSAAGTGGGDGGGPLCAAGEGGVLPLGCF